MLDFELGVSEGDILFHHAIFKSYAESQELTTNISSPSPFVTAPFPNRTTTWSESESTLGSETSTPQLPSLQSPRPAHVEQNTVLHPTLMSFLTADRESSPIPPQHSRYTQSHDNRSNDSHSQSTQLTEPKPSHHRRLSSITSALNALRSIPASIPYLTGHWRSDGSSPSFQADSDSSSSTHTSPESEPNTSAAAPSLSALTRRMGGEFIRPILVSH